MQEQPEARDDSQPLALVSSAVLGLPPERAAFEAHMDATAPAYWRTTAHAREAWALWQACWPLARAAIYSAEQAQLEAPLRARAAKAEHALRRLLDTFHEGSSVVGQPSARGHVLAAVQAGEDALRPNVL